MNLEKKFVCIHGHFYQPPRENAWLEVVEKQDSAAPFHDWNERIDFECYAPNTTARILGNEGKIIKIVNNYSRISFNFGPTLLSWLELNDQDTYNAIIQADKRSQERFGGHGSALAQVHSHLIMPLANRRDKITQIKWGIADFKYRFDRHPEGIWLAETAVDTETLELLVDNDIKFTILAPRQAKAIRKIGDKNWHELAHAAVDPRRPYWYNLPSGRKIALFFYDGNVSQGVAFEGLLNNGAHFANRIIGTLDNNDELQLAHIATDGESYGHHHRHGEMALASCLHHIETNKLATITNYGQFLELFPPTYEVQIHENSSWSCVHGVERWRSNCGCSTGGRPGWTQAWRGPLRDTLNWLRDVIVPIYEQYASSYLKDIWAARNEYIHILLDRNPTSIQTFLDKHTKRPIKDEETTTLLRLLEMQRHSILMFTSCGWFFDEVSGIETNQILQYANRAIFYAQQISGINLHEKFIEKLRRAPSNIYGNAADSYLKHVVPVRLDLKRVGMHYAVSSLFENYHTETTLFNYIVTDEVLEQMIAGHYRMTIGRALVQSRITASKELINFAAIYMGQQNILGNISFSMSKEMFDEMHQDLKQAFSNGNFAEVLGKMQYYFEGEAYSISHLFHDEKIDILQEITNQSLSETFHSFQNIYNDNYQLMSALLRNNVPIPNTYKNVVEHVINKDLNKFFNRAILDISILKHIKSELIKWQVPITDLSSLELAASERIFYEVKKIAYSEVNEADIINLMDIISSLNDMNIHIDAWKSQNLYFATLKQFRKGFKEYPSEEWKTTFHQFGDLLNIQTKVPVQCSRLMLKHCTTDINI